MKNFGVRQDLTNHYQLYQSEKRQLLTLITKAKTNNYTAQHKLKLNDDKTKFMMISSPYNNNKINAMNIKIGEETAIASKNVKSLGAVFD